MFWFHSPKNPQRSRNRGSEKLSNMPKVTVEMVKLGVEFSDEHSPGPLVAASGPPGDFLLFPFQSLDVTLKFISSL